MMSRRSTSSSTSKMRVTAAPGAKAHPRNGGIILSFRPITVRAQASVRVPLTARLSLSSIKPSASLPYLDFLMLRIFQQHGAQFLDRLSDCLGLDDFDSLDVIGFVQEKAAVNVHETTLGLLRVGESGHARMR